jgi:hypothetical protein
MRWLINYFREMFCKHDFVYAEEFSSRKSEFGNRNGVRVSATCKKCGYHKSYWKF